MTIPASHQINVWIREAFYKMTDNDHEGEEFYRSTHWKWNSRLTRAMGRARAVRSFSKPTTVSMDFSTQLFSVAGERQQRQTVFHECAHVVDVIKNNNFGHGDTWKLLMYKAGVPADRCHTVELKNKKNTVHAYCACVDGCHVSRCIGRRIAQGRRYRCRKCKCLLRLNDEPKVAQPENVVRKFAAASSSAPRQVKKSRQYRCGKCGGRGHNARTCRR